MLTQFQPLFIIGSPRSGTTMLQVLLGEHPQVATTVELTVIRRYAAPWLETWSDEKKSSVEGRWDQGLPFVWDRSELVSFLREFMGRVYGQLLASKPGASHILDKHPGNAMYTSLINELLPDARFIHVIRDGRDVACSMVSAAQKMGFGTKTIAASAQAWKRHVIAARDAVGFEGRYLEIRYEDLLSDGSAAYRRVLDFCKLRYEPEWIEATLGANTFDKMKQARRSGDPAIPLNEAHYRKGRAGAWADELSGVDRFDFENHAGNLLRELGYESDGNWWRRSALDSIIAPFITSMRHLLRR
jgi:hypothetical protein